MNPPSIIATIIPGKFPGGNVHDGIVTRQHGLECLRVHGAPFVESLPDILVDRGIELFTLVSVRGEHARRQPLGLALDELLEQLQKY